MARPERPIDADAGLLGAFASGLRELRQAAGSPSYRELARRAHFSATALSIAANGTSMPSLPVTLGYVRACGGDVGEWERRWAEAARVGAPRAVLDTAPASSEPDLAPMASELGGLGVRCSLPQDTPAFTGRSAELGVITAAAAGAAGEVVGIHTIGGMPGAGKTALAVRVAHHMRETFPDRQLFIDLHGHTPGREPVKAEDALAGLLAAVGVDARYLPKDLAGREAMWRDRIAGQRAVLVLDNATSSAQVIPLLPGGGQCLVLVTSRRHLGDLPGPVVPVPVDALPPEQAEVMFTRLAPRAAAAPAWAIAEVVQAASGLPLAISLLARVYARHPSWTLADLLAETQAGMLTLAAEKDSVAAAFEVSYRCLPPAWQRFFRLLAVHPGSAIDASAAAALGGVPVTEAAGMLDGLHGEGLLIETGYRRYGMHDLILRYARDLAAADPVGGLGLERLLDYYQHTAAAAQVLVACRPTADPAQVGGADPYVVPDLPDRDRALAWERAEFGNLLACLDLVTQAGQHARVVGLTAGIAALLRQESTWAEAIMRHDTAARAARLLGDRLGEGNALTELAEARLLTRDHLAAAQAAQTALGIYRDLGNRVGEGNALIELAAARLHAGNSVAAAQALQAALGIYRDLGNRRGEGNALTDLAAVRLQAGDCEGAAEAAQAALGIFRDLNEQIGQGNAWFYLGLVRRATGDYAGAAQALEATLGMCRDLRNRHGESSVLFELGVLHRVSGDYSQAASTLEAALSISRDLGDSSTEAETLNEIATLLVP